MVESKFRDTCFQCNIYINILARLLKNPLKKNAIFTNPIGSPGGKLWDELRIDWNAPQQSKFASENGDPYWALFGYTLQPSSPLQIIYCSGLDGRFFQSLARPSQPGWRAGTFRYQQSCYLLSLVENKDCIIKMYIVKNQSRNLMERLGHWQTMQLNRYSFSLLTSHFNPDMTYGLAGEIQYHLLEKQII